MQILSSVIRFPEIELKIRDAHKLRGYFGNLFKEHSVLLHNHYKTGESVFKYPLVQYKVLNNLPILIGLNKGAELLTSLFLNIKELNIEGKIYKINFKNINNKKEEIGVKKELFKYKFATLWMGLNQNNYNKYKILKKNKEFDLINELFKSILTGNILSFFKSMNYTEKDTISVLPEITNIKTTKFKGKNMYGFEGSFITNVRLPDYIGLGKSTSRGFGTLIKC